MSPIIERILQELNSSVFVLLLILAAIGKPNILGIVHKGPRQPPVELEGRSEERRVGKECAA